MEVVSCSAWTDTSAVLDTAREVWQSLGRDVLAVGASTRALAELEAQTGIAGAPLSLEGLRPVTGATFVVLEAHLLGARDLLPVLRAALAAEGTAVLVGDRNAVPAHDTGGLLGRLAGAGPVPSVELAELAERVVPARTGPGAARGLLRHRDVTLVADALGAREQLVEDWWDRESAETPRRGRAERAGAVGAGCGRCHHRSPPGRGGP